VEFDCPVVQLTEGTGDTAKLEIANSFCVLRVENFVDAGEGVDFGNGFVWAQAHDAGETEGETAFVAAGALNIVEGDFEDDGGLDVALEAAVFGGVVKEILG
jgi:hypothetical protein